MISGWPWILIPLKFTNPSEIITFSVVFQWYFQWSFQHYSFQISVIFSVISFHSDNSFRPLTKVTKNNFGMHLILNTHRLPQTFNSYKYRSKYRLEILEPGGVYSSQNHVLFSNLPKILRQDFKKANPIFVFRLANLISISFSN